MAAYFIVKTDNAALNVSCAKNDPKVKERCLVINLLDDGLVSVDGNLGNLLEHLRIILAGEKQKDGEIYYDVQQRAAKSVICIGNQYASLIAKHEAENSPSVSYSDFFNFGE